MTPLRDRGDLRKYYAAIPNIVFALGLSPYEITLYVYLKRTASDDGACWKSTETLARETGMSAGMVSKAKEGLRAPRKELNGSPLIKIEEQRRKTGGKPIHVVTITDIWPENMAKFATSPDEDASSYSEFASSPHEQANSPREIKNNPTEEKPSEEEESATGAGAFGDVPAVFEHEAVKLYVSLMRPDPGLPIRHAEIIAGEVTDLGVWRDVLVVFAGNGYRGQDGTGRNAGNAISRYRKELANKTVEAANGAARRNSTGPTQGNRRQGYNERNLAALDELFPDAAGPA